MVNTEVEAIKLDVAKETLEVILADVRAVY
jgi:hypothetical protein